MKRLILLFFILSTGLYAQTGIGTTTPNASAKLDVFSDNKGFLPPRVSLISTTDNTTVPNPAEGLLVYNKGIVGLQAGYYYWNGAGWATIATATSAGNGVTASDMVKLYSEQYSNATGKIAHANGYSFTVPVSGKYLFNFASTAYENNVGFTLYFKVRQGVTDLGIDAQTSNNNNARAEYNGIVEVNLQAGTTYNVYVTGGLHNSNDYDRVYYKQVSGNLPVTGQIVEYVSVSTINQSSIGDNRDLIFTSNNGGNIPYNTLTGVFTLSANKTYLFQAQVRANGASVDGSYIEYGFVDATSNSLLVNGTQTITSSTTRTAGFGSNPVINFIYTPTSNQTVKLRTTATTVGTQNITSGTANITQIGSSAIINSWTLSGTDTYNTTGNVDIGTATPSSRLNIVGGGVKLASGFGNSINRPSLNTSIIGNYEIRGVGSISGNAQNDLADDGFLRLSAGGGTSTIQQSSIDLSGYSATVPDMNNNIVMRTAGAERLRIDNSGNVNVTGKLNVGDPSGNVVTKVSGFVNLGSYLALDNLKATVPNVARKSLSIAAVATTFTANVSATFGYTGGASGVSDSNLSITTSTTSKIFDWHFGTEGDGAQYLIYDKTNTRMYRVSTMTGVSATSFFISIERLL